MNTVKAEGVILKRRNFGEADRILTVFTDKLGKISVMAKGVRRISSRRAGNVELLNRVAMFLHQGKGMPILTEAKALETYPKLKSDLTLSTYSFHILELVDKLTAQDQENSFLYKMLIIILEKLSKNPRQILVRAFEVKTLSGLGFANFSGDLKLLSDLETQSWEEIEGMKIEEREAMELERRLRYHIEKVIEGSLKSRQLLNKIHG